MLKETKKLTTAQFNKLSKAKKAVLVAEDVLLQIKIKKYMPEAGAYINNTEFSKRISDNEQINENFDKIKSCEVCALGSILLSCTHLGNKLTAGDISLNYSIDLENKKVADLFKSIFSPKTLLLIEVAFEGYSDWEDYDSKEILECKEGFSFYESSSRYGADELNESLSFEETLACNKIFRKFKNPTNRLKYICNNIITNNGQFKP